MITKHLELLGCEVEDRITGLKGVVTSVAFDLYGCIQVHTTPRADADGKVASRDWMDVSRVTVIDPVRVVEPPDFCANYPVANGDKGPSEKPLPR